MPMRDILLQLGSYPEPTPVEAIRQAVGFAAAMGGVLSALAVEVDIRAPSNPVADYLIGLSRLAEEEEGKSRACLTALEAFSGAASEAGILGQALHGKAELYAIGDYVAERARTRDLCIVPIAGPLDGQRGGSRDGDAWPSLVRLATVAALCNDARISRTDDGWVAHGDPMEAALIALAGKVGAAAGVSAFRARRLAEIPFDSRHRYMATLHEVAPGDRQIFVKGAPESVLRMCAGQMHGQGEAPLDEAYWAEAVDGLARGGHRVLALAAGRTNATACGLDPSTMARDLVLVGVVGIIDPPRDEARAAVQECRNAGIAVKMVTGDHAATAVALSLDLGRSDDPGVVLGEDIARLTDEQLVRVAEEAVVFARTSPADKLRLGGRSRPRDMSWP